MALMTFKLTAAGSSEDPDGVRAPLENVLGPKAGNANAVRDPRWDPRHAT
jgi:hypothetical protein